MHDAIHVCGIEAVPDQIAKHAPSHLITLINQEIMIETPAQIECGNHLKLSMNDISAPMNGYVPPSTGHVDDLIAFVRAWQRSAPLLIHCWAGVSRSTAAAYVSLCALNPEADEAELAAYLRAASPTATPNMGIVTLADASLGRSGRMVRAIEHIGRGAMAYEGAPFTLRSKF
jgi:predicted protein tyrosine phosphatase